MLIVVDPHSGVPVYRQLMDQIKFHIASGLIAPGDELPSTRALSAELGINPMTISKAYSYLEREEVVERRPGRPLVVKSVGENQMEDRRTEQVKAHLVPVVRMIQQMGINQEEAVELLRDMLRDGSDFDKETEQS